MFFRCLWCLENNKKSFLIFFCPLIDRQRSDGSSLLSIPLWMADAWPLLKGPSMSDQSPRMCLCCKEMFTPNRILPEVQCQQDSRMKGALDGGTTGLR